tara:strand:+ start:728 stop:2254 length:1527 start_codon:yes stop_codon:yes gene_type:complete
MSQQVLQGACYVENLTLVNLSGEWVDLTNVCANLKIYEGLDDTFCHGRLSIVDGLDLLKNYKIVGQESLTIRIRALDQSESDGWTNLENSIDKEFRVYAVSDETVDKSFTTKTYVLHFTDPKEFIARQTRINESLRGSYSSMLISMWRKYMFPAEADIEVLTDAWQESKPENKQVNVPNWTLMETFKYLERNANAEDSNWRNSFFFFGSLFGNRQRFITFDKMKEYKIIPEFDCYPRYGHLATDDSDLDELYVGLQTQVLNYTRPSRGNVLKGAVNGLYRGRLNSYDPVRKVERTNRYSMKKVYDEIEGEYPLVRLDAESETIYKAGVFDDEMNADFTNTFELPFLDDVNEETLTTAEPYWVQKINATNAYSNQDKLLNSETETKAETEWVGEEYKDAAMLERAALIGVLNQNTTNVIIPFRPDITVGALIRLILPTEEDDENINSMNDGDYVITHCVYELEPMKGRGVIQMKCAKDGYDVDIREWSPLKETTPAKETSTGGGGGRSM